MSKAESDADSDQKESDSESEESKVADFLQNFFRESEDEGEFEGFSDQDIFDDKALIGSDKPKAEKKKAATHDKVNTFLIDHVTEDQKAANEILVISEPTKTPVPVRQVPPQPITRLFTYPPPPQTGGITITNEDLACLNDGEYLNDAIIDFYLKFLYDEKLSDYHKEKTHLCSSYFFTCLNSTSVRARPDEDPKNLQMRRHSQVKTWTKHVDIFSKDFIIIPVNQKFHWFLAIVCYPGLVPEASESPVQTGIKTCRSYDDEDETKEANSTVHGNNANSDENSFSSCMFQHNEETLPEVADSSTHPEKVGRQKEVACICIFDSLNCPNRSRIVTVLREYLEIEWKMRKGTRKIFDKTTMPGYIMECPKQNNLTDCGIYVLQYVESFFENPIPYFYPIPNLSNWFPNEKVANKRQELKELILSLEEEFTSSSSSSLKY